MLTSGVKWDFVHVDSNDTAVPRVTSSSESEASRPASTLTGVSLTIAHSLPPRKSNNRSSATVSSQQVNTQKMATNYGTSTPAQSFFQTVLNPAGQASSQSSVSSEATMVNQPDALDAMPRDNPAQNTIICFSTSFELVFTSAEEFEAFIANQNHLRSVHGLQGQHIPSRRADDYIEEEEAVGDSSRAGAVYQRMDEDIRDKPATSASRSTSTPRFTFPKADTYMPQGLLLDPIDGFPQGLTLYDIAQQYPNHLINAGLDHFLNARWSALEIFQAMHPDAKREIEAKGAKCHENFITARLIRRKKVLGSLELWDNTTGHPTHVINQRVDGRPVGDRHKSHAAPTRMYGV